MKIIKINILELLEECDYDLDLIPYFINIILIENNIPVYINYHEILYNFVNVKCGNLDITDNDTTITIEYRN